MADAVTGLKFPRRFGEDAPMRGIDTPVQCHLDGRSRDPTLDTGNADPPCLTILMAGRVPARSIRATLTLPP
ncbi:MAG: hypothetical protein V6Z86_02465 [Hyphomicrobiales bacterium]